MSTTLTPSKPVPKRASKADSQKAPLVSPKAGTDSEKSPPVTKIGQTDSRIELQELSGEIVAIPLGQIETNPNNRTITDADVAELAESIKQFGQLEPATVRLLGPKRYELIGGGRRFAACKLANTQALNCIVCYDDDSDSLIRLAAVNTQRKDLNAIERAKLMQRLMMAEDKGGSGLTLLEAGNAVGLASESGSKNALRILNLPEAIQAMIVSEQLSERAARRLVPYCELKDAMTLITKELADESNRFELATEDTIPWFIERAIDKTTRPMDKREYRSSELVKNRHTNYPKLFAGDEGMNVLEIKIGKETWLLTTNCKEWDKLQRPLVEQKLKQHDSRSTGSKSATKTPAPEKSEAEKKKAANERLNRFTKGPFVIAAIRQEMACRVLDEDRVRLLPFLLNLFRADFAETLHAATVESMTETVRQSSSRYEFPVPKSGIAELATVLWRMLLWPVSSLSDVKSPKNQNGLRQQRILKAGVMPDLDRLSHEVPSDHLFALSIRCGVNLQGWWESARQRGPQRDLFEVWLDRHTTDQLQDLVKELKVKEAPAGAKHGDLVKHLLAQHVVQAKLAMPRRIK
jgi:ParB family transcriptional regulator, chromosome partitioning protein